MPGSLNEWHAPKMIRVLIIHKHTHTAVVQPAQHQGKPQDKPSPHSYNARALVCRAGAPLSKDNYSARRAGHLTDSHPTRLEALRRHGSGARELALVRHASRPQPHSKYVRGCRVLELCSNLLQSGRQGSSERRI
eukprot:9496670-Pyramimonas_sp.AAC.1